MSMEYIRKTYNVPAKRGGRVKFKGRLGTITSADSPYLKIRLDGDKHSCCYHPTYELKYFDKHKKDNQ